MKHPYGMGSTLHILIIADAGFFSNCLGYSSVKPWLSKGGPCASRSASSKNWLETQILRPLLQTYGIRNSGEWVSNLFLRNLLGTSSDSMPSYYADGQ